MAAIAASAAGLAQVLGVNIEGRSSADVIREIVARADELLRQLPDDFTQPLLPRDSLSGQQVRPSHAEINPDAHRCKSDWLTDTADAHRVCLPDGCTLPTVRHNTCQISGMKSLQPVCT